jgi:hypothetical protein
MSSSFSHFLASGVALAPRGCVGLPLGALTQPRSPIGWPAGLFYLLIALAGSGCGCQRAVPSLPREEAEGPSWFVDITEASGLHFVHDPGPTGHYFMPQAVGSGAALFDFDNDGRLDIYLLQNGGPSSASTNRLFRQGADGRFVDVSKGSGLDIAGYGMGVAIGDVNNDGWPDVLVTEYGGIRLFLNNGNGTFSDVTKEAGLDNPLWGTSASFVDYDRDGWLDLVVVNYVDYDPARPCASAGGQPDFCPPRQFEGTVTKLYHNLGVARSAERGARSAERGDQNELNGAPRSALRAPRPASRVRFEDATIKAGLGRVPGPGLGVVCADFNGDHWPDIFIANDGKPNRLWINQHDGTFKEEAVVRGLAYNALGQAEAGMGVALGDVDGDGEFDVFVTHLTEEMNTLWRQGPKGAFHDRTAAAGLANCRLRGTGFGTQLADFDQDGALDLAVANGRVSRDQRVRETQPGSFWSRYAERNQLFANDGTGRFRDISAQNPAFCGTARVARGLACGDLDGDGALDLLVTNIAGPARLYRNVAPGRGHWLLVRAFDPALKRDAYGAEITVQAGGRKFMRWVNPGSSYLSSNDPRAHLGLGPSQRVDAIQVVWPDGSLETFPGCAADQVVMLCKGKGLRQAE